MRVNLDSRISIDQKVTSQDATYGTQTVTWALLATVYAEIREVAPSRSESVKQGLAQARDQTRVRIRYRSDVDSSMRIRYGSRTLQIVGGPAEVGGRREWLEMVCEEYSS